MLRNGGYWLWRLARMTLGVVLLIAGIVLSLPGIPGPGSVLVVLSLGILSADFVWAKKLHGRLTYLWHETLKKRRNKAERGTQNG
jgi:hypothetical protein